MELFITMLTYTSAVLIPVVIIAGLVFMFVRYGLTAIIQSVTDKLDYIINKIIEKIQNLITFFIEVVGEFIFKHANEIQMLVGGFYFYQHPPQGDKQYIAICVYFATNTLVLLRKGNINIEKIADSLINKIGTDKANTSTIDNKHEVK